MENESNNYFFREGINVLSLFDGMSCGQIALERCGIKVNNYFASEIDKHAIKVTQHNYPQTKQIGDVCGLQYEDGALFHHQNDKPLKNGGSFIENIDLLYGGSPCQGFSFAGKQLNFEDPRSKLFFEFVRLVKEVKPTYWMLENVKMKKEYQDVISQHLGVEPIEINSKLVSAQNRNRLYWANFDITQPQNKKIILNSILEYDVDRKYNLTEKMIKQMIKYDKPITDITKSPTITTEFAHQIGRDNTIRLFKRIKVLRGVYRKATPIELERLQTVSDNYTNIVSDTRRFGMLGNGWTIDVIVDIFNQMVLQKPKSVGKNNYGNNI